MVSRQDVARKLTDYLQHSINLSQLVDWAENAMQEAEFDEDDLDTIRDVGSRLGLADVRAFGLTWEDCEGYLTQLGYRVYLEVSADSKPRKS